MRQSEQLEVKAKEGIVDCRCQFRFLGSYTVLHYVKSSSSSSSTSDQSRIRSRRFLYRTAAQAYRLTPLQYPHDLIDGDEPTPLLLPILTGSSWVLESPPDIVRWNKDMKVEMMYG